MIEAILERHGTRALRVHSFAMAAVLTPQVNTSRDEFHPVWTDCFDPQRSLNEG